jgi:Uma2 family endonuclease
MPLPPGLVIPETGPATEWVRGEFHRKVSPSLAHSRLQANLSALLLAWGRDAGVVASEHDMDVTPAPGDTRRYLPDVHFTSFEKIRAAGQEGREIPEIAPQLGIEILSPHDDREYLDDKIAAYLAAGSDAVLIVDPRDRSIIVHRPAGVVTLRAGDAFADPAFPGLRLAVDDVFGIFDLGPPGWWQTLA